MKKKTDNNRTTCTEPNMWREVFVKVYTFNEVLFW